MLITQIFPEQLEMISRRTDRIWATIKVMKKSEVRKDRLDWDVVIVKDQPGYPVCAGKTHLLYLHRLHSFHERIGVDMYFDDGRQGVLTLRTLRCEWASV